MRNSFWESNDTEADASEIDPGPDPRTVQGETAARHALKVSTPEPIKMPRVGKERRGK